MTKETTKDKTEEKTDSTVFEALWQKVETCKFNIATGKIFINDSVKQVLSRLGDHDTVLYDMQIPGHNNMLIIHGRKVYRFDPEGIGTDPDIMRENMQHDTIIKRKFQELGFEYYGLPQTCPDIGIQILVEHSADTNVIPEDFTGYCANWSILYALFVLMFPHSPIEKLHDFLIHQMFAHACNGGRKQKATRLFRWMNKFHTYMKSQVPAEGDYTLRARRGKAPKFYLQNNLRFVECNWNPS